MPKTILPEVIRGSKLKTVSISSIKGGVSKTTLAIFLSLALKRMGKRVLAIDLDPNNNLTDFFLRDFDLSPISERNVFHVLKNKMGVMEASHDSIHGVSILPSTPKLAQAGIELARDPGSILRFANKLKGLDFDFVMIDTPPSLSFELSLSLFSSDLVLSPISFNRWTVQAIEVLQEEIMNTRETKGDIELLCVPSIVTEKEEETLRKNRDIDFTKTSILKNASIRKAVQDGRPLKENSLPFEWFMNLAKEMITR